MPHQHECRHCGDEFICAEDAAECFARFITCQECFWTIEFKHFVIVSALGLIAVGLTMWLAQNWR